MKTTGKIISLLLLAGLTGCQEELDVLQPTPQEKTAALQIKGTMPGTSPKNRAYVDESGGFFWNAADTIYVIDSFYNSYGAMFTANFSASPESEGQKTAVFQYDMANADPNDMNIFLIDYLLHTAKDYSAFYPTPHSRGDAPASSGLGGYYEYHFPQTQVQEGTTSRHLGRYMLMTSGRVDIPRDGTGEGGLTQDGGFVRLPDFSLAHRTSLFKFKVLNRQLNPIEVKRIRIHARKKDGSTAYFLPSCAYYVARDSVDLRSQGAYGTLTVELQDKGTAHYTVPGQGVLSAYAALLPNTTEGVEFTFEVETTDALYKTLAFPGDQIRNRRFEAGTYYTFELLVDHGLNVQGWEEDRLDNIQFGQDAFSVSPAAPVLPLEGGQTTLQVSSTHSGGWTLAECPSWLEADATSAPQGTTHIRLSAPATTAERSGTLCFVSGNLRKWLTVRQTAVTITADDALHIAADEINATQVLRILQDNEPASVYCDPNQRSFNTSEPLQVNVEEGKLHLRFYSPRKLENVEIWAKMPDLSEEEFLLARFEEVPPFIDFYKELPFLTRDCTFKTLSGKSVTIRRNPYFPDGMLSLRAASYCDYWRKLQQIKHGWTISFSLYGGDPTKPDGGPSPNWIGIRPVHCREAVALFLNIGYLTDMKEHEALIRANEHLLYGNGGTGDPVTADRVLSQMKAAHNLKVGLVSPKHAAGLGGPGVFGLDQMRWLNYNTEWGAATVMFHELGHVLGYNHTSSFTNGPWAHQLMSNFYLEHLPEFPIDSPDYLDSKNNPNLYK